MSNLLSALRAVCFALAIVCVSFSSPIAADDHSQAALAELTTTLDGILSTHFRRSMRVQAALLECGREEAATSIAPTEEEMSTAAEAFLKEVRTSSSDKLNKYLASIGESPQRTQLLESVFKNSVHAYFSGIVDGASGGFIWIDADDKVKLCDYMQREAEDFIKLRVLK